MRRFLLAMLILLFAVDAADARRKRHRYGHRSQIVIPPPGLMAPGRSFMEPRMQEPRAMIEPRGARRAGRGDGSVIPPDWQLAAPDPNWNGKRFLSPDGASWFAAYTAPAEQAAIAAHMKTVAFADGETITYLRGERTWVAVSGFRGSRIFYRKAVIACAGTAWKHIAFEYPAELKREMDRFVISAAQALDRDQAGCDAAVSTNQSADHDLKPVPPHR
jgi:serine/threonine-protein kinase